MLMPAMCWQIPFLTRRGISVLSFAGEAFEEY